MSDVERRLQKASESWAFAGHALAGDFPAEAGRAASMAACHAAQALILARTGRTPKTHSGARVEFTRLVQAEAALDRSYAAFLGRAYELKAHADYDQAQPVTAAAAQEAIEQAAGLSRRWQP